MGRGALLIIAAAFLCLPSSSHAAEETAPALPSAPDTSSATKTPPALADLRPLVEAALREWTTPGLALGVVANGQVILAEGYGLRNVEKKLPVTGRTLFAIGSTTKAFTTFLLGTLVDDGLLDWDTPVIEYLPDFRLMNEYATFHITARDLVTHRSGLPRHDLAWYGNDELTRAELVYRLRYLEPTRELRERFQYSNLMYLAAGYLAEQLTGQSWEAATRERIFDPLGMTATNFSVEETQRSPDHALPYRVENGRSRRIGFRSSPLMGPSGSITSSVNDLTRWLLVHLQGGRFGGRKIIGVGTLNELHSPQMVVPGPSDEPDASPVSYAMGWFVNTWRGHYRAWHTGNMDGFSSLVTLYPNDGVGVVVLSNRSDDELPELVTKLVSDRVLGLELRDWLAEAEADRNSGAMLVQEGTEKGAFFRKPDTEPSRPLEAYAGHYWNDGYGELEIVPRDRSLVLVYNNMELPLIHWHYDVFAVGGTAEKVLPEGLRIAFPGDLRGRIAAVAVGFEPEVAPIRFARLPDPRLRDPEHLSRLAGIYELPGQKVTVTLRGEQLRVTLGSRSTYTLLPGPNDDFTIASLSGYGVSFTLPEEGPATEIIFIQPNGVFAGPRVEDP